MPLPFYVYSISYGSVPIFIPQLYPHSFYNSRYGMEMLPVLAVLGVYGVAELVAKFGEAQPLRAKLLDRLAQPVALMLVVVNLIVMLHEVPLVLHEAMVNSRGRLAIETPLAQQLVTFQPGAPILMENSTYVGRAAAGRHSAEADHRAERLLSLAGRDGGSGGTRGLCGLGRRGRCEKSGESASGWHGGADDSVLDQPALRKDLAVVALETLTA